MSELVDKTIANMEELVEASKAQRVDQLPGQAFPRTERQKQELYVKATLMRCRRCGDFLPTLIPAELSLICGDCQTKMRAYDAEAHGGEVMWFVDMVRKAGGKDG